MSQVKGCSNDKKTSVSHCATTDSSILDILNKIVQSRIDLNRRYVDEILEKIQEQNRQYFLDKYNEELAAMEREQQRSGGSSNNNINIIEGGRNNNNIDIQKVMRHHVMAETYKSIVERCFPLRKT